MTSNGNIILRNKRLSDARNDYEWQRDRELAGLDATTPITCSFQEYLTDYTDEIQYPSLYKVGEPLLYWMPLIIFSEIGLGLNGVEVSVITLNNMYTLWVIKIIHQSHTKGIYHKTQRNLTFIDK